jgi:hypothetical protein
MRGIGNVHVANPGGYGRVRWLFADARESINTVQALLLYWR